jgi:mycothiol system anti-sigma-R factor
MPKKDCDEALTEIYRYLDGELTVEVRERIRIHLDDCPPCGDAAGFEAELRRVIQAKCIDRVPDDLRARILAACSEDPAADPDPEPA